MASSIDAIPTKALESLLECYVCLETLNDPRTLHCFHSFCKGCLEKFIQQIRKENENPELNTFNCPICRSEFTLNPAKQVDGIGANYFVRSMLDVMAVESRVKGIPCQHCDKASVSRCVDCEIFMCEGCLQGHNNYSGFKTHHLLSMDELCKPENRSKIRGQPRCKDHDDEIKRYFCETCEELICQYCRDDDHHHDHKHSLLKKAGEEKKEDLTKWCATLTEEFNGSNKILQAMAHVAKVLDNNVKASKKKIQERKDEILAAVSRILDKKEKSLTDKIDIMYKTKSTAINKQLDEAQGYANQVKKSIDVCTSLLEGNDVVEIVSSHRLVCKNIEMGKKERPGNWKPIDDGSIRFEQCSMDGAEAEMRKLSKRLGEIKGKTLNNDCSICHCTMTDPKVLPKCGHTFCAPCIDTAFTYKMTCPICQEVYGITEGDQPYGTMTVQRSYLSSLSGYAGSGVYTITYNIPSGKQNSRHPNPGKKFYGAVRRAFLPATKEGEEVLKLLQKAFEKKLIFTVRRSTTTGKDDCVTWNDIHHKTSVAGGPQSFGYPDPDYLGRVKDELKAKGIVPE